MRQHGLAGLGVARPGGVGWELAGGGIRGDPVGEVCGAGVFGAQLGVGPGAGERVVGIRRRVAGPAGGGGVQGAQQDVEPGSRPGSDRVAKASTAVLSSPSRLRCPPSRHGDPGAVMHPVLGLVIGVLSRLGSRASRSRISGVISAAVAEVPAARGTRMWRPPLLDWSVTATPPHSVIQVSARVKSASTVS